MVGTAEGEEGLREKKERTAVIRWRRAAEVIICFPWRECNGDLCQVASDVELGFLVRDLV